MKHQAAVGEISSIVSDLHTVKTARLLRGLAQYYRLVAGGVESSQNHAFANSASGEAGFSDGVLWAKRIANLQYIVDEVMKSAPLSVMTVSIAPSVGYNSISLGEEAKQREHTRAKQSKEKHCTRGGARGRVARSRGHILFLSLRAARCDAR